MTWVSCDTVATSVRPGVPGARRPRKAPAVTRHGSGLVAGSVFDRAAWTQVVEGLREWLPEFVKTLER